MQRRSQGGDELALLACQPLEVPVQDLLSSSTWLSIVPSFCCASVLTRAYNTALFI